ncbi:MAG: hypothetical protein ACK4YM_09820 [Novosphingobium sp.]
MICTSLAGSASAQSFNLSYQTTERNGVCYFSVDGPGPKDGSATMTLEFSYRVEDGNLGLDLKAVSFPLAAAKAERPVTLKLETDQGDMPVPRSAGYAVTSRFQRIWAGWGAGAPSQPAFAKLRQIRTVTVVADKERYGPFDLQLKSLPYNVLNNCAKRVRGEPMD